MFSGMQPPPPNIFDGRVLLDEASSVPSTTTEYCKRPQFKIGTLRCFVLELYDVVVVMVPLGGNVL